MSEYKFWKLLSAQWSWDNDRWNIIFGSGLSFIVVALLHVTNNITITPTSEYWNGIGIILGILIGSMLLAYHTVKFTIFSLFCIIVIFGCKEGNIKAVNIYQEMLTWRKKEESV